MHYYKGHVVFKKHRGNALVGREIQLNGKRIIMALSN